MNDILEEEKYDYVIDAIDTLSPKVFLIYHSLSLKLKIVSSMGAGGKFDPCTIRVADISETNFCNLARILRKKLHKLGVRDGFLAVYSPEVIDKDKIIRESDETQQGFKGRDCILHACRLRHCLCFGGDKGAFWYESWPSISRN